MQKNAKIKNVVVLSLILQFVKKKFSIAANLTIEFHCK